jgi:hypothetical protein
MDKCLGLEDHGPLAGEARMKNDPKIRQHVLELLEGGHGHLSFDKATADLSPELRGIKPAGLPYSPCRLIEHMRIAQWDILQFSVDPHHISPEFPAGYWPTADAPPTPEAWSESCTAFRADLQSMMNLIASPEIDLYAPISHGDGQTILREALLVADHNAYHLGQLVVVRRLLGAWEDA